MSGHCEAAFAEAISALTDEFALPHKVGRAKQRQSRLFSLL
jgi:hypothetical protein